MTEYENCVMCVSRCQIMDKETILGRLLKVDVREWQIKVVYLHSCICGNNVVNYRGAN